MVLHAGERSSVAYESRIEDVPSSAGVMGAGSWIVRGDRRSTRISEKGGTEEIIGDRHELRHVLFVQRLEVKDDMIGDYCTANRVMNCFLL